MTNGPFDAPPAAPTGPQLPPPPASPLPPQVVVMPARRRGVWSIIATVLLVISVLVNVGLFAAVAGLTVLVAPGFGGESLLEERVIESGPAGDKIAVIRIDGILDDETVERISPMIEKAAKDDNVKAVILRVDSPGGGITASDVLHHKLSDLGDKKPIVTAMEGIAASGGYYIACASDYIVAQPTTITGSIGIIAEFFFLNTLMKDKLGVTPVTLKIGEKKDWPNMFGASDITPEQKDYFEKSLLKPGYDRFVDVVVEGRKEAKLTKEELLPIANGAVYSAEKAKELKLIDEIGYFETAVDAAKSLAKISDARVVEYRHPPGLSDLLGIGFQAKAALDLRPEKVSALAAPRIMYLWQGF